MYRIFYKKSVKKELKKLDITVRRAIVKKILALANNPRPIGVTKLSGTDNTYRIRHTDYRIIYQIKDRELVITLIKVGHRREVYRDS